MKKTLLITALTLASTSLIAQTQIGNSDMEQWETVASDQEPVNWNSFLSASGGWAWAAANQIESSTDVRPGSAGTASCRIWSRSTFGIVANGNVTTGQINMGSTTPSDPANYNHTVTGDTEFSVAMPDMPDSIVFWAKFTPNGGNGNARMKATVHTDYNYRDPEDAGSSAEVVGTAVLNYPNTNGWVRKSVPFSYAGPASAQAYLLVTFTTNEAAGGGNADDEVLIDDIELIYNPNGLEEITAYMNVFATENQLNFKSTKPFEGEYSVYDMSGAMVQSGPLAQFVSFEVSTGVYVINVNANGGSAQYKVFKK